MKKTISILLIFTLLTPYWLFVSLLQFEKHIIKNEIKKSIISGLDRNELVLIKTSLHDNSLQIRWEDSKEFEYADEMYDVIESEIKNDSVYYWCWKDNEETKLNRQLNTLVQKASESNPVHKNKSEQLLNLLYSYFNNSISHNNYYNNSVDKVFIYWFNNYNPQSIIPETPPPKA